MYSKEGKIATNTLTLYEIQQNIIHYGAEYFNPQNNAPLAYVKTLFIVMAYDEVMRNMI